MAFNKNELILDRVRSVVATDVTTKEMLYRMTSIEDPSLNCSAEGEDVTDALGSVITTLYRAKNATFSGTNSLISLDLAAAQFGSKKAIASAGEKIVVPTYEILTIADGKVTLKHKPVADSIKYIYGLVDGEIATKYVAGASVSATDFLVGENGEITTPTGVTGKVYVEYDYESEKAVKVTNSATKFPEVCGLKIFAYFKDKCNENLVYSGAVIAERAKINPESIELALTSTGKHPFEYKINREYCEEDGDLFSIIVAE